MFWAIASSIFVIYLYRKLNARNALATASAPADSVEAELAALNASITALEVKIGNVAAADTKP